MSAWILTEKHLRVIVSAYMRHNRAARASTAAAYGRSLGLSEDGTPSPRPPADAPRDHIDWAPWFAYYDCADTFGRKLAEQNARSVAHRYHEPTAPVPFAHKHTPVGVVQVLKAIACYHYQACETADYEGSEVHETLCELSLALIPHVPGYADAAWGID